MTPNTLDKAVSTGAASVVKIAVVDCHASDRLPPSVHQVLVALAGYVGQVLLHKDCDTPNASGVSSISLLDHARAQHEDQVVFSVDPREPRTSALSGPVELNDLAPPSFMSRLTREEAGYVAALMLTVAVQVGDIKDGHPINLCSKDSHLTIVLSWFANVHLPAQDGDGAIEILSRSHRVNRSANRQAFDALTELIEIGANNWGSDDGLAKFRKVVEAAKASHREYRRGLYKIRSMVDSTVRTPKLATPLRV